MLVTRGYGHLLWWSTNTRAAATLLAAGSVNRVPTVLVLDPSSPMPPERYLDSAIVVERERSHVSEEEIEQIVRSASKQLGVSQLLLAPTSEYLQSFVHARLDAMAKIGLHVLPKSALSYSLLSDKANLSELVAGRLDFPLPKMVEAKLGETPFVAKPKRNLSQQVPLRPYLVHNEITWQRYLAQYEDFFPQELVRGESLYWCGIRSESGDVRGYFQSNIGQVRGGGSISVAQREPDRLYRVEQNKIRRFLNKINYVGPIMFEFRVPGFFLIEINPRFWGPLFLDSSSRGGILESYFLSFFDKGPYVHIPGSRSNLYVVPSLLEQSVYASNSLWPMRDWEQQNRQILRSFEGVDAPDIGGDW